VLRGLAVGRLTPAQFRGRPDALLALTARGEHGIR